MLHTTTPGTLSASTTERLDGMLDWADELDQFVRSPRTLTAYRSDWRQLQEWAAAMPDLYPAIPDPDQLTEPLPVALIDGYVTDRSKLDTGYTIAPQTLSRHLAAIR